MFAFALMSVCQLVDLRLNPSRVIKNSRFATWTIVKFQVGTTLPCSALDEYHDGVTLVCTALPMGSGLRLWLNDVADDFKADVINRSGARLLIVRMK